MNLSQKQKECFEKLWFIYGNNGRKCTMLNHKLIQGFIEYNEDRRDAYQYAKSRLEGKGYNLTMECWNVVNLVLENKLNEAIELSKSKTQ